MNRTKNNRNVQQGSEILSDVQQNRLENYDTYITNAAKKYNIEIDAQKFKRIELHKTDMVVMKSHFAGRLVVPVTEPLNGLPKWQRFMDSLYQEHGI